MADARNRCARNGRLVGADQPIPEAPYDFVWPSAGPDFGCNQLICRGCGDPVRSQPGFGLRRELTAEETALLYDAARWRKHKQLVRESRGYRLYVCRCGGHQAVKQPRALDDPYHDDFRHPPPRGWHCGGHPRLELPVDLDGERLTAEGIDWEALIEGAVRDERAKDRPEFARAYAACWWQRLYHLLEHLPQSEAVARAVQRGLVADGEPVLKAAAVDFFRRLPLAPGAEAVASLALREGQGLMSQPNPERPHQSVGELLQLALAERLRSLAHEASPDQLEATCSAAHEAVTWPSRAAATLLEAVAERDSGWVRAHLDAVWRANPATVTIRAMLRGLSRALGPKEIASTIREIEAADWLDRSRLDRLARQVLPPDFLG